MTQLIQCNNTFHRTEEALIHRNLLKKVDLASLNSEIDKLDIGQLETTTVDLSKLSDVLENEVAKKTEYNELVEKVSAIQTTDINNLVIKTVYNIKVSEIEKKITDHNRNNKHITTQKFRKLTSETLQQD